MLAGEFAAAGKLEQFEPLKPWLLGEIDSLSQVAAAITTTPLPSAVAEQELQFFLSRMAQDLVDYGPEAELPPGEEHPKE